MKFTGAMGAAVISCLALAACGSAAAPTPSCDPTTCVVIPPGQPITLATLLDPQSDNGADSLATVDLAIDYTDGTFDTIDGQVLGHDVKVVAVDDDCTRAGGTAAAEQLMGQPDIVAVIGTTCSESALDAAASIISAHNVLMMSPTNTSPALTSPEHAVDYYFRTAFNDLLQARIVADFVTTKLGAATAATVSTQDAYSTPLAESFSSMVAANGAQVVASPKTDGSAVSVQEVIAVLAAANPGAVFLPLTDAPSASIIAAMKADPLLSSTPIIVSEFAETPAFLAALGPLSDGVYGSNVDPSTLGKDDFYTQEFVPAYHEFVRDRLPLASTQATFDAVNLELAAIRHVAEPTPDGGLVIQRQALREFMLRVSGYPGLTGPLECTPLGDCVRTARMAIYQAPQWPIVSPTAEPVYAATLNLEEIRGNR